jgi:hypothetical protein
MVRSVATHLADVIACIRAADGDGLLSVADLPPSGGLAGLKTVAVLRRLLGLFASDDEACYLEVGVYRGLTLLSVAGAFPSMPCFGIDNFSLLDPDGVNLKIVEDGVRELGIQNATLINEDVEAAFGTLDRHLEGRRIAVYFYDGAHDYRSQLMGLMLALPHLHARAVIVIDDCNYDFVRQSTRDFLLAYSDFKMVFEGYSPAHPANLDAETRETHAAGWLNGVNILVRDPDGMLPAMVPPASEDRTLFVNEWLVHRHGMAELAPEALDLAQAVCAGDTEMEAAPRDALLARYGELRDSLGKRFADRNTYSEALPVSHFNVLKPDTRM